MFQIRIQGRRGQGVVSAADLISVEAFLERRLAQAIKSFASERMGAPVMAFCRIDAMPIRLREPVLAPAALLIQDATLLHHAWLFQCVQPGGIILINVPRNFDDTDLARLTGGAARYRVCPVHATELAQKHVGRAVPNVPMLAALAAVSEAIALHSLIAAIRQKFPHAIADKNIAAATAAFALARETAQAAHA